MSISVFPSITLLIIVRINLVSSCMGKESIVFFYTYRPIIDNNDFILICLHGFQLVCLTPCARDQFFWALACFLEAIVPCLSPLELKSTCF